MLLAHHPIFVGLSVLTAWLGAWTALDLFRRTQAHTGLWRRAWVAAAGLAMGLSIWSMHFIAMLGFSPGTHVRYDVRLTVLSLLLAVAATTFAFVAARPTRRRQACSGLVMGAGICGMHYMGMAAVTSGATLTHVPLYVGLAFVIAVVASTGALAVAMRETTLAQRVLAAVVLGFAVVGMHYTAMLGVRMTDQPHSHVEAIGIEPYVLAAGVAAGTLFILLLALIAALADRRFQAMEVREAQRSEERLRAILDNLPLGIFVAESPSGAIRFANAEAAGLLGRSRGLILWAPERTEGAIDPAGQRLAAEAHVLYQAMHEKRRVGPRVQNYRRADGQVVQLEVTAAPIPGRDGDAPLSVAAFQDVTARVVAEKEARQAATLRESEERFRLIAEQAPVMLWMSDAEGRFVYLNSQLRRFHGFADSGANADWTVSLAEEDRMRLNTEFRQALRSHQGFSFDATCRRADGELRMTHILACPRFDDGGQLLGHIGVNTDVTDARLAERKLQEVNELLEERVAAALTEKAQAEAALMHAQRLESLGRLTGGVAHDFNNLLTVVIGALDIILRSPEDAARRARLGEAALAAARRGERLTAQLLAFARRQPLRPAVWDLNELIRECEPLLHRAAGESITLTLELCSESAVALIDRTQFEASLLNLIVNAADASSQGTQIRIGTQITSSPAASSGRAVQVSVRDQGHGMTPEVIGHIFEPFFTTKPPGKGTGLGLSQVYGFVKQSGGEVQVDSTPGAGTCINIVLPLESEPSASQQQPAPAVPASRGALKVLLAEDDASVSGITEAMLMDLGHEVVCTADAEQALQVLRSPAVIDVLLSDMVMPGGMSGVELAREAVKIRPRLTVLLCSGYPGESLDDSIGLGAWPFLRKPYVHADLADALARATTQLNASQPTVRDESLTSAS